MWRALCPKCVDVLLERQLIVKPVEECTNGHMGERACAECKAPFTGGCTDVLSSGDYAGHAKQPRDPADPCASQWFGFPQSARNFQRLEKNHG